MYSSLLATSVCLICLTRAGQLPFDFEFKANFCSIAEQDKFLEVTPPQDILDEIYGFDAPNLEYDPTSLPGPWTRESKCIADGNTNDTYCVYTSDKFANGRGISFFTAPSIAQRIEALSAFTQEGVHDAANDFENAPWDIKTIPGRGNGLFANRRLRRGDKILADTPVGVYQSDAFFPDYTQGYPYLRAAFEQLPEPTRELVLGMATHNEGDPIMERVNTNAFAGEFEGAAHFLLYPETGKMNHDCRPNSMYYYDPSTLIHATHASRTILPGEEITITYINILQSRSERQEVLKAIWGFECTCALCSGSSSEFEASDARIQQIIDLQGKLADWEPTSVGSPAMAEDLLKLYDQEHLHAAIGTGHMFAALAYNAVGNTKKAVRHGKKAIDAGMVGSGSSDANVAEIEALLDNPRKHWSFMARPRR